MLIDWFPVGAQTLNFLILLGLMKRFLYKPVLDAIDAREKLIATELADAAAKKTEATKERDEFQQKNAAFDAERAALLTTATGEAKTERERLIEAARQATDALSVKRQQGLQNEAQNWNQALLRRTQDEVFAIARKTLGDLANSTLEQRMSDVFTSRVCALNGDAKTNRAAALKSVSQPALVRSAFDLPAKQRAAIQTALNETFSAEFPLRFETAPDLVGGIELMANGQKWRGASPITSIHCKKASANFCKFKRSPLLRRPPLRRPARRRSLMNSAPDNLQTLFDDAFHAMSEARDNFAPQLLPREVGTITNVLTGIATVSGLPSVGSEELLEFPGGVFGIAFNVDETEIGVVLLGNYTNLHAGAEVERTGRVMDVAVGDALLGRVIDPLGRPLDDKGPISATQRLPVERPAAPIMARAPVTVPLQAGLLVVDALIPIGRGQRELILGDRQTGKTAIALDTILNQRGQNVVCVYCAIG